MSWNVYGPQGGHIGSYKSKDAADRAASHACKELAPGGECTVRHHGKIVCRYVRVRGKERPVKL